MKDARTRRLVTAGLIMCAAGLVAAAAHAQGGAFGPRPGAVPAPSGGLTGYILAKQAEFYRLLSTAIRAVKADGSATFGLLGLSFLYGIFHAAGPGHGKAVISSYLIANHETWRRGVALSFLSAMVQACVAVAIVSFAAFVMQAARQTICNAEPWTEVASYGLIAAIGASLLWTKGRAFFRTLRAGSPATIAPALAPAHVHSASCGHDHHHHDHSHDHGHHAHPALAHAHRSDAHVHAAQVHETHVLEAHTHPGHAHVHDAHCGHAHGPEPQDLAGPGGWQRGIAAVFAVGLRPCSGAIIVLVYALAQGLYWAGVASAFAMGLGTALTVAAIATLAVGARGIAQRLAATRDGRGALALKALEALAAAVVFVFGLSLLLGYVATERLAIAC